MYFPFAFIMIIQNIVILSLALNSFNLVLFQYHNPSPRITDWKSHLQKIKKGDKVEIWVNKSEFEP